MIRHPPPSPLPPFCVRGDQTKIMKAQTLQSRFSRREISPPLLEMRKQMNLMTADRRLGLVSEITVIAWPTLAAVAKSMVDG